jgi:hypothetical protein
LAQCFPSRGNADIAVIENVVPGEDTKDIPAKVSNDDMVVTRFDVEGADKAGIKKSFSCGKEVKDDGVDDLSCERNFVCLRVEEGLLFFPSFVEGVFDRGFTDKTP